MGGSVTRVDGEYETTIVGLDTHTFASLESYRSSSGILCGKAKNVKFYIEKTVKDKKGNVVESTLTPYNQDVDVYCRVSYNSGLNVTDGTYGKPE